MIRNYLNIALRQFVSNKVQTLINITGLALGIAAVYLMALYVDFETGYDRHYPGNENIYRIVWNSDNPQTRTPHPLAQAMAADFTEVESAVSLSPLWGPGLTKQTFSIRNPQNDLRFDESEVLAVDSTFFDVFRIPIVRGDARQALRNTNAILLSESAARKYFHHEDPIGKSLLVEADSAVLEVLAVYKDFPAQSHFHADFMVSYVREKSFDPADEYYTWADFGHFNYLRLHSGANASMLESRLMDWSRKYLDWSEEELSSIVSNGQGFKLQPVRDIHLHSRLRWELEPNGNIEYVYIMALAAALTLVIACVNFTNLATARSVTRAKEIGIRKTLGAVRRQLSIQLVSESVLLSAIAVVLALFLVELSLPWYNMLTGHRLDVDYITAVPTMLGIAIIVGIASTFYPTIILAAIQPHAILRGSFKGTVRGRNLQRSLIVVQFSISMVLLSSAAIIFNQLNFIQNTELGFEKKQKVVIPIKDQRISRRFQELRTELLKVPGIEAVTASSNLPGGQFNQNSVFSVAFPNDPLDFSEVFVDKQFLQTFAIDLVDGRFFHEDARADSMAVFVMNETGARQLGVEIGDEIRWVPNDSLITGPVIGIVRDFHFQSLHTSIRPLLMVHYPAYNHIVVSLNTAQLDATIAGIRGVHDAFAPSHDFEFSFMDQRLQHQYQAERRTAALISAFAVVAICIACFGLIGMALHVFHQRTKEVSVRKVLGASLPELIMFLLKDFTRLIIVAVAIAAPLTWWGMNQWIDNFTYQVTVSPLLFFVTGFALLLVSWMALAYFTLRTARVNPAETLKNE